MTANSHSGKGPPPVRRSGPSTPGGPIPPTSGGQSAPFDDDRTVTVGQPPSGLTTAPHGGLPQGGSVAQPGSDAATGSVSKSSLVLIAAAVVGIAVVGFGTFALLSGSLGGDSDRQILFSRGSDFDLYAAAPGQELTRDNRIGRDTQGFGTFRSWNGASEEVTEQLQIGGRTLGIVIGVDSSSLVDLDDGTEIFEASSFSRVITDGEQLFIREFRDGGDRCHQGPVDQIERVSRGGRCSFSLLGHLLTSDDNGDESEINVTSAGGAQLLNGPVVGRSVLSQDGAWLIDINNDNDRVRILNVITGREVYDEAGTSGWLSGPDGLLMVSSVNDDFETSIRVLDQAGAEAEVISTEGNVEAAFLESGDIVIAEWIDGRASVARWELATSARTELIDTDSSLRTAHIGNDVIIAEADDLGYVMTRHAADGSESLLWEYEGDDMSAGSLRIDDEAVIVQTSSSDNGSVVALIPLDGSDPAFSDEWDGTRFLDFRDESLLVSVQDGSTSIALSLRSGDEPIELFEAPEVGRGLITGDTVLVTVFDDGDQDTIAVDRRSGEPIADLDYSGYSLAEDTDWFFQDWLF